MARVVDRLSGSARFALVMRSGRRAGSSTVVVHLARPDGEPASPDAGAPARVGFVVSRAVGNAVTRNRVKRRLRALTRVAELPTGSLVVVRALPPAATASYAELRRDLARCLSRVTS